MLAEGICIVWTSPVLSVFQSNDTNLNPLGRPVTSYDVSMIGALYPVGCAISPFVFGKLIDVIGRKNSLILMAILNIIFFIVLAFSSNIICIFIARFMNGISSGGSSIAIAIFLSEITEDHNRGKFGCLLSLFLPLGQLYGYVMGFLFPVKYFTIICAIPLVIHTLSLLHYIPETPMYLLLRGKRYAAAKSLARYRGAKNLQEIERELQLMEFTMEKTTRGHEGGLKSLFSHQPTRRGFIVSLGLFFIKLGTGVAVLFSFMAPIFEEAGTGLSGNVIAILVGLLKVGVYFFVSQIVEKLGRKPLMLSSVISCSIALFILGFYFFMKENDYSVYRSISWLPLASVLLFIMAFSVGAGPIPTAIIGELFATNVRSTAVSTVTFFGRIFHSTVLALFPIVVKYIGVSGCMWFFSGFCVFGAVFIYVLMPETKGKSIYEIQEMLKGKVTHH